MARITPPASVGTGTYVPLGTTTQAGVVLSDIRPTSPVTGTVRIGLAADTTAPTVPTGLAATPSSTSVALSWSASTDAVGVTGYRVYRGGVLIGSPTTTSYTDTGLTSGTSYTYTVAAVDGAGNVSAQSSGVTTTTLAVPGAPTALSGTVGNAQVALTWTAPASNGGSAITDYLVEYKLQSSGTWLTFADGTSTTAAATVTGLTNGSVYDFRVSATNVVGTGTPSSTYSATPSAAPTTLAADDFNRANSTGITTSSGGQTWTAVGGRFDVDTNQLKIGSYGGPTSGGMAVIDASTATCTVSVDLAVAVSGAGLVFRYVDSSNFYTANFSGSGVAITKYTAGAPTVIRAAGTSELASGDTLVVNLSGSTITLKKVSGGTTTTIASVTDSTHSGTRHGVALNATGSVAHRWDNFLITSP